MTLDFTEVAAFEIIKHSLETCPSLIRDNLAQKCLKFACLVSYLIDIYVLDQLTCLKGRSISYSASTSIP